jgi:hypothetical protein
MGAMKLALASAVTLVVAGTLLSTSSAASEVASEQVTSLREGRSAIQAIPWCTSEGQWNCVESVEYLVDGQWQTALVAETPSWGGAVLDSPGLTHEMGRTQIRAEAFERYDVDGTEHRAYQLQLQAWPHGKILLDPVFPFCDASKEGQGNPVPGTDPCIRGPWLAETSYRMTFRSSRFQPILAMASMRGMDTTFEEIPGGVRFSLGGSPGASQMTYGWGPGAEADKVDAVSYEWAGLITDARGRNGVLAGCKGLGIVTAHSNGYGGQMPEWDAKTGSLSFGVGGRHYAPDGSLYRGRAEIFVPGPLARCMWKVDPRQTARMEVEVYTENGEEAAGTKSIAYDSDADLVKMIAVDFTYSEKQIAARSTPIDAKLGVRSCDPVRSVCVTVDRARKTAKVSVSKVAGASEVVAVALRGTREEGPQVSASVKKGKASLTVKLSGGKSKGQVWVVRTPSTFISSFQVG